MLILFCIYSNLHTSYILRLISVIGLSNFTGMNQFHPGHQKEFWLWILYFMYLQNFRPLHWIRWSVELSVDIIDYEDGWHGSSPKVKPDILIALF